VPCAFNPSLYHGLLAALAIGYIFAGSVMLIARTCDTRSKRSTVLAGMAEVTIVAHILGMQVCRFLKLSIPSKRRYWWPYFISTSTSFTAVSVDERKHQIGIKLIARNFLDIGCVIRLNVFSLRVTGGYKGQEQTTQEKILL
jgi:hypothetical protein